MTDRSVPRTAALVIAGAVIAVTSFSVLVWIAGEFGLDVPPEVATAFAALLITAAYWVVPEGTREVLRDTIRVLADVRAWLAKDAEMRADRSRLVDVCCAPDPPPHLEGAPRPASIVSCGCP